MIQAHTISHTIGLDVCCCGECGVFFAVPTIFIMRQSEIHCPNGHVKCYGTIEEETDREERAEVVQALHRAEQAEARAAEAESKLAELAAQATPITETLKASIEVEKTKRRGK